MHPDYTVTWREQQGSRDEGEDSREIIMQSTERNNDKKNIETSKEDKRFLSAPPSDLSLSNIQRSVSMSEGKSCDFRAVLCSDVHCHVRCLT